ncbi:MAG: bifunctional riboflavin kinase/FAD synthetase [Eubacterium sp.]|nr:bifunctional riboflavin kinase/FAD synthetase [Eubacterium sp.]
MEIIRSLDEIQNIGKTAVALGNFDGVHLGHQELIRETVEQAGRDDVKSAVFTFSNHPSGLIPGVKAVKSILGDDRKAELIEEMGVDYLFDVPFTEELRDMEAEDFVKELLVERMNVKDAFCGYNYQFGARAFGTAEILEMYGSKYGFDVFEMPPFEIEGQVVSSSLIRLLIEKGCVSRIKTFMGRHYEIEGEVVVGNRLGKKLGFPTSNLELNEQMAAPPNGVYTTYCLYNGRRYPSITNVGIKPTVGEFDKNVETHIFDFDKELYGKHITVEFLKKMRDEQKFDSLEVLSAQIVSDCEAAKEWFSDANKE